MQVNYGENYNCISIDIMDNIYCQGIGVYIFLALARYIINSNNWSYS